MRGKYITTSLKLAVLAKGNQSRVIDVKETKASIRDFEPIWTKEASLAKQEATQLLNEELAVA